MQAMKIREREEWGKKEKKMVGIVEENEMQVPNRLLLSATFQ